MIAKGAGAPTDVAGQTVSRGTGAIVVRALGALLAFLAQIAVARVLGITEFGAFTFTLATIGLGVVAARLGLDTTVLRLVSSYSSQGDAARYAGLSRFGEAVTLGGGLIVAAAAVLYLQQSSVWADGLTWPVMMVVIIAIPSLALASLRSATLLSLGEVIRSYAPELLIRPIIIIAGVVILAVALTNVDSEHAIAILGFSALVSLLISSVWSSSCAGRAFDATTTKKYDVRDWAAISTTFWLGSIAYFLLTQADILIVGTLLGEEAVGGYSAAARTAIYVQFLLLAIQRTAAPMVSRHFGEQDVAGTQKILDVIAAIAGISGIFIGLVTIVFAEQIMWLFGAEFQNAAIMLQILAVGQVVNCITGATNITMNMTGHHREALVIQGVFAIASVICAAMAAIHFGVVSVAIVMAVTIVLWNLVGSWYLWRVTGLRCWITSRGVAIVLGVLRKEFRARVTS